MNTSLIQHPALYACKINDADKINRALLQGFQQHIHDQETRKTHFFNNRYENVYIDSECIPEIRIILDTVIKLAAEILSIPANRLRAGLWFNAMGKGDVTT
ncbi:MAG: hypothetical protein EP315_06880, partial [Gammaproteobacteria bacterium]